MLQYIEGNSLYLAVFLLTIGIAGLVAFGASFGVQYMKEDYSLPYRY